MSEQSGSATEGTYVLKRETIVESLARITSRSVHRHFAGYLALLVAAREAGRLDELKPSIKGFFNRFLSIPGAAEKPYFDPFDTRQRVDQRFLNGNVAGSYAPRSLREENPLRQLCKIEKVSGGYRWSLDPDHGAIARRILGDEPLPGASLAAFLYRDFGFRSSGVPSASVAYESLVEDFGFAFSAGPTPFGEVFADDTVALGQPFEQLDQT